MNTFLNTFNESINYFFPNINIEIEDNYYMLDSILHFYLGEDFIYIDYLNKNNMYTGTEILIKFENLIKMFPNIKYIELEDGANIYFQDSNGNKFTFSLSTIQIMSNGMSWYNKFGYYQAGFIQDRRRFLNIIDCNFLLTFDNIRKNISNINNEKKDYLYNNLTKVHNILFVNTENKNLLILRCLNYLFDNLFTIDEFFTIRDVGNFIKNCKNINNNTLIYVIYIILIFMETIFQYRWDNQPDNGLLIKHIKNEEN